MTKRNRNWIIALVLTAAAGFVAVQTGLAPSSNGAALTPVNDLTTSGSGITDTPTVSDTPVADTPSYEGCAYVWAYHDAPDITAKVDAAIRALNSDASGHASLFGEDCVYADGHSTFGAMETDFYVYLPVKDLKNNEAFGNWMAQVLPLIVQIPREEIQGNYGFVEFWFKKSETEHVIARVPVQDYLDKAQGITGAELFRRYLPTP